MKKTISIILAALLVLCFVTSCNQDEAGVFKTISEATKKSKITCLAYLGKDSSNVHYVITANRGLISFKLEDSVAVDVTTVASQFSNDEDCCLVDSTIYAKDSKGDLYTIDLKDNNKATKVENNTYARITRNGHAINADLSVCNLKTNETLSGVTDVKSTYSYLDADYYVTTSSLFKDTDKITSSSINLSNIVLFCGDYVVIYNSGKYEIHKIISKSIGDKLSDLPARPTAAYADENTAYFITSAGAYIFNGTEVSKGSASWNTLNITDFVEIDGNPCAIDSEGNLMILEITNGEVSTIPLFVD